MKRGRKPKPQAMKDLQGNPGRRKSDPGVQFSGRTTPPKDLDPIARQEWRRLAPHLEPLALLTPADRAIFRAYCEAYSRMVRAQRFLNSKAAGGNLVHTTHTGALKPWPEVNIVRQEANLLRQLGEQFGLTPAARARLTAPTETTDPTEAFLFGSSSSATQCDEDEPN